MKTSGRVSVDTSTFTDTVSSTITTNLSPLELSLLDIFYKKMFPQYKNLCDEYDKAKTLAEGSHYFLVELIGNQCVALRMLMTVCSFRVQNQWLMRGKKWNVKMCLLGKSMC